MKKLFLAVSINENGKQYAYVDYHYADMNLTWIAGLENAEFITACGSRRKAARLVKQWNKRHQKNGTFLYN